MNRFGNSLSYKFTLATIAGFLISSLVFLGLFLTFYQAELAHERAQAARDVNRLLQSSLENAMLKRDLDGLIYIVKHLGEQPNIHSVMITNPQGMVRFSSRAELEGLVLDGKLLASSTPQTYFMQDERDLEVLRSINPVHNRPQCLECHGSVEEHPVNGILVVDYDATSIRHKARNTTLILMGAGALIVIINLIGGWWFIRRFILRPVETLSAASHLLARGELDTRVQLKGGDELSMLGESFNLMATNLQSSMRKLEEGEAFLQAMVDAIPDGVRIVDDEYNTLLVNRAFRQQVGNFDQTWMGGKCYQAAHNLDEPCPAELVTCPLQQIRKTGESIKVIHHHTHADATTLDVEIYAAPMTIVREGKEKTLMVESIRDLSKQVLFTHEQRLSELGRLAAGVAHEIFNPLSAIKLALHSLATMIPQQQQSEHINNLLEVVDKEIEQCIQITDRLLRLSAVPTDNTELVDVHKAIQDILSLVKWDAEEASIEIIHTYPEQPLRIFASESEMRMMILNLVQNAFHAMPSGGVLRITETSENAEVIIRFEDTGVGISADNLSRIFMPFFSRRADDVQGTGLGLPISRTIVQSFDGVLEVDSELGEGSCFTVSIPEASVARLG